MYKRITRRLPSPVQRCAGVRFGGVFFRADGGPLPTGEFIPLNEVACFFTGGVDGWVAHMLLTHVAGCVGVVEVDGG